MKSNHLTYVLVVLVLGTLGLAFARQSQNTSAKPDQTKQQQSKHFPTAEYNEPDSADAEKNRVRKEKQLRHNDFKIVAKEPPDWQTECVFVGEGAMNFPALPVRESDYVVVGRVTAAEAHLSENKKNVFSEFTVLISKVFQTADNSIIEGSEIAVNRIGGFVKYPNGRTILYRVDRSNMPLVGERYLLFLKSKNNDLSILTAYSLSDAGISPLDNSPQFETLQGLTEEALFQKLQDSLIKSAQ